MLAHVLLECVNGNKSLALTEEFVLKSQQLQNVHLSAMLAHVLLISVNGKMKIVSIFKSEQEPEQESKLEPELEMT